MIFSEVAYFDKIRIIFETHEQILVEPSRHAYRGRKVRLAIFSEADVHDRVNDEFIVRVAHTNDGPDFERKSRLREFRRRVAELEIDAVEKIVLVGVGRDEQGAQLEGVREELLILDREGQIEPDFPPAGHALTESRRPVDGWVGDETPRKRRGLGPRRRGVWGRLER